MLKKMLIFGTALIMGLCILIGCGTDQIVEFKEGAVWISLNEKKISKIIDSFDEFKDLDEIDIHKKYDLDFFNTYSLVIVAFITNSYGGQIEEIKLSKNGRKLMVEINGALGIAQAICQVGVALEVKKEDMRGVKIVKYKTNLIAE